jgi:uncharacterized membrane protein YkgB
METEMNPKPIFFAWTKSFWLGIFPALLTIIDTLFNLFTTAETAVPAAAVIAAFLNTASGLPWLDVLQTTPEAVHKAMTALAPVYAMIVGYQRMHAARPYTIDPRAIK